MNREARRQRLSGALSEAPTFHQEVIAAYHRLCPDLRQVKSWKEPRRKALDARIAERKADGKPSDTIGYWEGFFEKVASSDFLCGRTDSGAWLADLEWLLKSGNFTKTIEGRYDSRQPIASGAHAHG